MSVEGTLEVINQGLGSLSNLDSSPGELWKGIFVQGTLSGSGLQVSGAERALILNGGSISLMNSKLTNNLIGLHLLGGTLNWGGTTANSGGTIGPNSEYGIKEDGTGTFNVKNTLFQGNGMNYYQSSFTKLLLEEINKKPGNSGNSEAQ